MLTIQINKKWFDMILSGIKTEEYREIKPYYTTRFYNMFGVMWMSHLCGTAEMPRDGYKRPEKEICFQNGYSKNSPSFVARCSLKIGTGNPEWGAEQNKQYYVLKILEIKEVSL